MSTAGENGSDTMQLCASCGVAGGDDIKLKNCIACYLVKYCSVKCQRDHWPSHKKECKKRAAELKDEILFKQPESSYLGDCPICCLPLPIDPRKSTLTSCCSKQICEGCSLANQKREKEARLLPKCPFCRKAAPSSYEKFIEQLMKRVEANDPVAMCQFGTIRYQEGDYEVAFDHLMRAVALGNVAAHYQLSLVHHNGLGVERDERKELHHTEQAAIGGHPYARHNLGLKEWKIGRMDRAAKHFIIAAKLGHDISLNNVKNAYKDGVISKEEFTKALRGYQAAIAASKSPQREAFAGYAMQAWSEIGGPN